MSQFSNFRVDVKKVHKALKQLLDGLANDAKGYIILKDEGEQTAGELQELANQQVDGAERDKFLQQYANEASPTLLQPMKVKQY